MLVFFGVYRDEKKQARGLITTNMNDVPIKRRNAVCRLQPGV